MAYGLSHLNRSAAMRRLGAWLCITFAAGALAPAQAQPPAARTHSTEIAVLGDSVAHDLARGMEDLFSDNPRIRVIRQTKFATGLVRTDYYNWNKVAHDFLRGHKPDVIFVVIGGNDNQAIRRRGERYDPGTPQWRAEYGRLASQFMNVFAASRAKVYWVSLPPVRSDKLTAAYRGINRIYRREAERHGFHYVDVSSRFVTRSGAYSSFGESLEGVRRQIRKDDGEHFTDVGRRLFASYVARAAGLH